MVTLVQIEKPNGRGTAFPEVYIFKLDGQFGALISASFAISSAQRDRTIFGTKYDKM
jgi:hypothetical protein